MRTTFNGAFIVLKWALATPASLLATHHASKSASDPAQAVARRAGTCARCTATVYTTIWDRRGSVGAAYPPTGATVSAVSSRFDHQDRPALSCRITPSSPHVARAARPSSEREEPPRRREVAVRTPTACDDAAARSQARTLDPRTMRAERAECRPRGPGKPALRAGVPRPRAAARQTAAARRSGLTANESGL